MTTEHLGGDHHRLRADQRFQVVGHLGQLDLAYASLHTGFSADNQDRLWVDLAADAITAEEFAESDEPNYYAGLTLVGAHYVADLTHTYLGFHPDIEDVIKIPTRFNFDFAAAGWAKVAKLLETGSDRDEFNAKVEASYNRPVFPGPKRRHLRAI